MDHRGTDRALHDDALAARAVAEDPTLPEAALVAAVTNIVEANVGRDLP